MLDSEKWLVNLLNKMTVTCKMFCYFHEYYTIFHFQL